MQSEQLGLQHKKLLRERLRNIHTQIAEYSFANLYLFRNSHNYELITDKEIFIKGISYDGFTYIMPTKFLYDIDVMYLKGILRDFDFLFPIPDDWLAALNPSEFDFTYKDGDTDYIYTSEKIATYAGKKMHGKRNLLHQFESQYEHTAHPLIQDRMNDAVFILEEWQKETGVSPAETDFNACMEGLNLYDELAICGGIYYAGSEPAGFIVGEELNEETFALHFAKGRTKFKGIYQYIFNNFANILPKRYKYLNFEQDLDKENLRLSKSSYYPDILLKKMRVSLKKPNGTGA